MIPATERKAPRANASSVRSASPGFAAHAPPSGGFITAQGQTSPAPLAGFTKAQKKRAKKAAAGGGGAAVGLPSPPSPLVPDVPLVAQMVPMEASVKQHLMQGGALEDVKESLAATSAPGKKKRRSGGLSSKSPHSNLRQTVQSWSCDEVLDFLTSIGVHDGSIHQAFSQAEVDGKLLLELDSVDLMELGIQSQLKRKKILLELKELKDRVSAELAASGSANNSHVSMDFASSSNSIAEADEHAAEGEGGAGAEDPESSGSETEQLTQDILSGSALDLSWSTTRPQPPAPIKVSPQVTLPRAPQSSKAASAAQLSVTSRAIEPDFSGFLRRNVDLLSMSPTADLTLENALVTGASFQEREAAAAEIEIQTEKVLGGSVHALPISKSASASPGPMLHPGPLPTIAASPVPSAGFELNSPPSAGSGTSSAAKRKRAKKKKAAGGSISISAGNSGLDLATTMQDDTDGDTQPGSHHHLSLHQPHASLAPSPRANESLFGASAVGVSPIPPPSRSPVLRAAASPLLRGTPGRGAPVVSVHSGGLYNAAASAPIPTDVRENINISFPDGSDTPKGLEREEDDEGHTGAGSMHHESQLYPSSSSSQEHVRPPPVLIVSGGGGAFMHPTHCPSAEPIIFRGNRYVRSSSYPPVALSRAYALLNLFGFRKQNWRFDLFGGVVYFLLAFSILPVCNLQHVLDATSWYDAILQYILAVLHNYSLVFQKGYVSLFFFAVLWIMLLSFGEMAWPWYKRFVIGTCHTLAHSLSAVGAVVLMDTFIELGIHKKVLGQGEVLYATFVRNFPVVASVVDDADTQFYGIFGMVARLLSNLFDVPDNIAHYKHYMCNEYDTATRRQLLVYYFNCALYLWVMMTPLVSFMFGAYLYIGSAFLNSHYTEAFSSLRIEGYKNVVRFHINKQGGQYEETWR